MGDAAALFAPWMVRWRLVADGASIETPTSNLLPVLQDGEPTMLKMLKPTSDEGPGIAALGWFAGDGAVRVVAAEGDALLMERAIGRRSLTTMAVTGGDEDAIRIMAATAKALHAPRPAPPPELPTLTRRFRALYEAPPAHPVLARCAARARRLVETSRESVVLHGDLHHENVLDSPRGWLAIDPKGVAGERAYDVANLFLNPAGVDRLVLDRARAQRLAAIVSEELALDPARVLGFAFAHAGLSAAWCIEDGIDPRIAIEAAEMLEPLAAGAA
ncbi:phosphotransferase [Kaistia geumhonensis]|uniref:Streptomycin 6-kinase n=1 Tax=Kaistia geumhonensis TaxID=410839 RepID=A0ABU0M3Q7_9HYPH|nr:aminoglycoside phosphotransferase family protein [Kaistia geumhonensis]MCX5479303.1 phosphotransferase [Kaistia geumhonensis]MDQ0515475.1 streptomycin 6-kinase [Kaistia geumhonensis]